VWCPTCGDEYRTGFTRCHDCNVDLVDEPPPPPPEHPVEQRDHGLVEYDLAELGHEQVTLLELMLKGAEIPFAWEPVRQLLVGVAVSDDVDEILDFVDASADADTDALALDDDEERPGPPLASPWRRLAGSLVDDVALVIVALAAGPLGIARPWVWIWPLVYEIVPVAISGKTVGKLVAGTRVVRLDQQPKPGLRVAAIRGLVPELPRFVFLSIGVVTTTPIWIWLAAVWVWTLAVYLPVFGADRRGLHDRIAGTVVVHEPRANAMMAA
jgi:uncharacterized RDD family membrane protein YckC